MEVKYRPKTSLDQFVDNLLARAQPGQGAPRAGDSAQHEHPWPCRYCGKPATIEAVEAGRDRQRTLTFWHCEPCQTWAVTPNTVREPPVWVRKTVQ